MPRHIGLRKRVAKYIDLLAIFIRGNGEAVLRLIGPRGRCPAPRPIHQLASQVLRPLGRLKHLGRFCGDPACVRFLLVESAGHDIGDQIAQRRFRLFVGLLDVQPCVIDAFFRGALRQLHQFVPHHLAIEHHRAAFPVEFQPANLADRWHRALMGDAYAGAREVDEKDLARRDPGRHRAD